MNQIEDVEFEEHYKSDDIVEFLNETKLKKGYDDKTLISCFINRDIPVTPQEVHEKLIKLNPKPTIYIIGHPREEPVDVYQIFTPYPSLSERVRYNIKETAFKYELPEYTRFVKGMSQTISYEKTHEEQISLYEIFGLDEKLINSKYKANVIK